MFFNARFFFLFQNNKKSNKNLVNCRREGQITKNIIIFDFRIKHHSFFKIEFFCFFISFEEGAAVLQEIDWGGRIREKTTFLWAVISKSIQQMRSILLLPKYFFRDFSKSFASSQKHALSSRFARVVRKCRRTISGVLGQMYAGYTEDGLNWKIETNGLRK